MNILPLGQKSSRDKGSNGETSSDVDGDEASMSEDTQQENRTPRDKKLRLPGGIFVERATLATSSLTRPREMTFAPETSNDTL